MTDMDKCLVVIGDQCLHKDVVRIVRKMLLTSCDVMTAYVEHCTVQIIVG